MSNNDPYNHAEFVKLFDNCIKDVRERDQLENNDDVDLFKNAFKSIAENDRKSKEDFNDRMKFKDPREF